MPRHLCAVIGSHQGRFPATPPCAGALYSDMASFNTGATISFIFMWCKLSEVRHVLLMWWKQGSVMTNYQGYSAQGYYLLNTPEQGFFKGNYTPAEYPW